MEDEYDFRTFIMMEYGIEPAVAGYSYDGYGYQYTDNGSGSMWLEIALKERDATVFYSEDDVMKLVNIIKELKSGAENE